MAMLTTLFHRLRMKSHVRTMRITAGQIDCNMRPSYIFLKPTAPYLRLQSFKKERGACIEPSRYHEEPLEWFEGIVSAVYACDLPITTLTMDTVSADLGMPFEKWHHEDPKIMEYVGDLFTPLESLDLPLVCINRDPDSRHAEFSAVAKALTSATKLRRLRIRANTEEEGSMHDILDLLTCLPDEALPALETLILEGGEIGTLRLTQMVKARASLRRLELEDAYLFDDLDLGGQVFGDDYEDAAEEVMRVTGFREVDIGADVELGDVRRW
ncbi:hypothetical protein CLAFUW4_14626 [Fulvia fulva]|uniref:Uncharacterized protein n=1 Tax=Passalora fulva TaxID=5499 RepID=A0A9Q8PMM9_PASFU|nr:uncharacterized protein CLAFUR5_14455 [Fulvia fulva]KAK4609073.1 hypothetical protein CLAFUR4_14620 [Fulvia fulva]KAK4609843.1 hypothetical protein CLAFUR0_14620 [Fulvia fulva]UJO25174.1 hypothetical protein CLAFUR5_14455 [Fulvia fulva]WPV22545.1 hypothetical protein CLAFUW4_14626 [Fulvia fulva]WPV37691.1 hypothetical protein CLAFUW7_14629 [Fulvia fulva]